MCRFLAAAFLRRTPSHGPAPNRALTAAPRSRFFGPTLDRNPHFSWATGLPPVRRSPSPGGLWARWPSCSATGPPWRRPGPGRGARRYPSSVRSSSAASPIAPPWGGRRPSPAKPRRCAGDCGSRGTPPRGSSLPGNRSRPAASIPRRPAWRPSARPAGRRPRQPGTSRRRRAAAACRTRAPGGPSWRCGCEATRPRPAGCTAGRPAGSWSSRPCR